MPRQRNPQPEDDTQHLPVPVPVSTGHKEREHRVDPYRPLDGAVPVTTEPPKRRRGRKPSGDALARTEDKERKERYDRYLDALIAMGGDTAAALATVFGVSVQEAEARFDELHNDVRSGIGSSTITDMLERRDLDQAARLTILRRHAYSPNPAASLKALDMLNELDSGRGQDAGSYESYLRIVMAEDR